jgi:hypothetical protein
MMIPLLQLDWNKKVLSILLANSLERDSNCISIQTFGSFFLIYRFPYSMNRMVAGSLILDKLIVFEAFWFIIGLLKDVNMLSLHIVEYPRGPAGLFVNKKIAHLGHFKLFCKVNTQGCKTLWVYFVPMHENHRPLN